MEELLEIKQTKRCSKCGDPKSLDQFYDKSSRCKPCVAAYSKVHRERNKDKIRERRKAYDERNKERRKAYQERHKGRLSAYFKAYYERNKERKKAYAKTYCECYKYEIKSRRFKQKYGISLQECERLFALQNGKCPICKNKMTKSEGKRQAVIDHSHGVSGHVRGLICASCNLAEGILRTPEVALRMYNYMMGDELLSYQNLPS